MTKLRARLLTDPSSVTGRDKISSSPPERLYWHRLTRPPIRYVPEFPALRIRRQEREVSHSLPSAGVEVKNA
jgi:hypothetical protein